MILSGAGVYDGSEIHEATLSIYFLDQLNVEVSYFAPNKSQHHVIDHQNSTETDDTRNCLVESARIARGPVKELKACDASLFDALIIPGGFGAAKNLCDYAFNDLTFSVNPELENIILSFYQQKKPIGLMCISPVIVAKLIPNTRLTLGLDPDNNIKLDQMNSVGVQANYDDVVTDLDKLIFSTPAYMVDASISQIATGIEKLIHNMVKQLENKEFN